MTKAQPSIHVRAKREQMGSIIVPGRRSLGEQWTRLNISHDADQIYVTNEGAAEAPESGRITAVAAHEVEYTNYVLEAMQEKALEARRNPQGMSEEEKTKLLNELWMGYIEQRLKLLKGQSQFGPSGMTQRQRVNPAPRES